VMEVTFLDPRLPLTSEIVSPIHNSLKLKRFQ
jgi:hypothetical protein